MGAETIGHPSPNISVSEVLIATFLSSLHELV